jgi:hypothetical protein
MSGTTLASLGIKKPKSTYPVFQRPPWIDAPASAEPFIPNAAVKVPAIGSQAVIVSFTVPANRSGVIWRVANGTAIGGGIANWINGSGSLVWQILRDGSPLKNMNNIISLIGLVEQGGAQLGAPLRINANDNIALIVENVSLQALGQDLVGLLSGYYYPSSLNPSTLR